MKKILFVILSIILFSVPGFSADIQGRKIQVVRDGCALSGKYKIYDYRGDTYFSVRELARMFDAGLSWHPISGKVSILMNNKKADFYIKTTKAVFDGKIKRFRLPVHLIGNDVYVPENAVTTDEFSSMSETENLWNSAAKILTIEKKLNLSSPRFYTCDDFTKISFEMSEKLPYTIKIKKPGFVEVSFLKANAVKETVEVNDGVIKKIELRPKTRETIASIYLTEGAGKYTEELVNDPLALNITFRRTPLAAMLLQKTTEEYKITLSTELPVVLSGLEMSQTKTPQTLHVVFSTPAVIDVKPVAKKKIKIVLDAGHGGDDPGAIGQNGVNEKEINLAIIKELKRLFDKDPENEFETVTTRIDDTFIPLADRTKTANDVKADLFVSIHCNASLDKKTKGFEIYFLSENASDEEAAATAVLENSVIRLEEKPSREQQMKQDLLWSLAKNEFINESSELCCYIMQDVSIRAKVENRGVRQAGFYVLRGAGMPSVLVECAFLSNIEEESLLKTSRFQRKMADSVFNGVKKYVHRREGLNCKWEKK